MTVLADHKPLGHVQSSIVLWIIPLAFATLSHKGCYNPRQLNSISIIALMPEEITMRNMTVCFLLRATSPHEVLLGYKKRGFGAGKFAGIGGRVEAGETIR